MYIGLGDDTLILSRKRLNRGRYLNECGLKFNMICKIRESEYNGVFLRLMVFKNNNTIYVGPDIIRLKNRYEVTNGEKNITKL